MYRRQASRYEAQGSVFAVQANARRNATPQNLGNSISRRKGMRQSEERDTSGCHANGAGEQFVTQGAISNKRHAAEIRIAVFDRRVFRGQKRGVVSATAWAQQVGSRPILHLQR